MSIDRLRVSNVLGVRHMDVTLGPVTLIAGPNGSGKSSTLEALRFGVTGELPGRVQYKKDADALVSDGAKSGKVTMTFAGVDHVRTLPDCKGTGAVHESLLSAAARVALGVDRFALLDAKEQRRLLGELTGARPSKDWVAGRLREKGATDDMVAAIVPMLRLGFDDASTFAGAQATTARGEWKGITGEVYGSKKADGWEASVPDPVDGDPELLAAELNRLDGQLRSLRERIGAVKAAGDLPTQQDLSDLREAIADGDAALAEKRAELQVAEQLPAAAPAGTPVPCPCCNAMLLVAGTTLRRAPAHDDQHQHQTPAATNVRELRAAVQRSEEWLRRTRADLAQKEARLQVASALSDETPDLAALQQQEGELAEKMAGVRLHLQALNTYRTAAKNAAATTARAAEAHAAAERWKAAAELLAPDGLPAELLAKQLEPVRELLADAPDGVHVAIAGDMTITLGGRPYRLLSESEQWRVDAVLAVALARLGGVPTVVLDRFDVLDVPSRPGALSWLIGVAADEAQPVQVVMAGTLKAAPSIDGVTTVWLGAEPTAAKAA